MVVSYLPLLAQLSIGSAVLSLLCLLVLHFLSPEFQPSWRMVSEYALGKYKWVLTAFFTFWGASTLFLALLLSNLVDSTWAFVGVILLFVSAIGTVMGGLFDVKHKLHGLAAMLGLPTLNAAAFLIAFHLIEKAEWQAHSSKIMTATHGTWLSLVLMIVSMVFLFSGFKKAGVPLGPDAELPEKLPEGVLAFNGYANRILVVCYIGWLIVVAKTYLATIG